MKQVTAVFSRIVLLFVSFPLVRKHFCPNYRELIYLSWKGHALSLSTDPDRHTRQLLRRVLVRQPSQIENLDTRANQLLTESRSVKEDGGIGAHTLPLQTASSIYDPVLLKRLKNTCTKTASSKHYFRKRDPQLESDNLGLSYSDREECTAVKKCSRSLRTGSNAKEVAASSTRDRSGTGNRRRLQPNTFPGAPATATPIPSRGMFSSPEGRSWNLWEGKGGAPSKIAVDVHLRESNPIGVVRLQFCHFADFHSAYEFKKSDGEAFRNFSRLKHACSCRARESDLLSHEISYPFAQAQAACEEAEGHAQGNSEENQANGAWRLPVMQFIFDNLCAEYTPLANKEAAIETEIRGHPDLENGNTESANAFDKSRKLLANKKQTTKVKLMKPEESKHESIQPSYDSQDRKPARFSDQMRQLDNVDKVDETSTNHPAHSLEQLDNVGGTQPCGALCPLKPKNEDNVKVISNSLRLFGGDFLPGSDFDYFNGFLPGATLKELNVQVSTLGNHEFDNDWEYVDEIMAANENTTTFVVSNLRVTKANKGENAEYESKGKDSVKEKKLETPAHSIASSGQDSSLDRSTYFVPYLLWVTDLDGNSQLLKPPHVWKKTCHESSTKKRCMTLTVQRPVAAVCFTGALPENLATSTGVPTGAELLGPNAAKAIKVALDECRAYYQELYSGNAASETSSLHEPRRRKHSDASRVTEEVRYKGAKVDEILVSENVNAAKSRFAARLESDTRKYAGAMASHRESRITRRKKKVNAAAEVNVKFDDDNLTTKLPHIAGVLISHLGFETEKRIAAEIGGGPTGLTIIFSGHSHTQLPPSNFPAFIPSSTSPDPMKESSSPVQQSATNALSSEAVEWVEQPLSGKVSENAADRTVRTGSVHEFKKSSALKGSNAKEERKDDWTNGVFIVASGAHGALITMSELSFVVYEDIDRATVAATTKDRGLRSQLLAPSFSFVDVNHFAAWATLDMSSVLPKENIEKDSWSQNAGQSGKAPSTAADDNQRETLCGYQALTRFTSVCLDHRKTEARTATSMTEVEEITKQAELGENREHSFFDLQGPRWPRISSTSQQPLPSYTQPDANSLEHPLCARTQQPIPALKPYATHRSTLYRPMYTYQPTTDTKCAHNDSVPFIGCTYVNDIRRKEKAALLGHKVYLLPFFGFAPRLLQRPLETKIRDYARTRTRPNGTDILTIKLKLQSRKRVSPNQCIKLSDSFPLFPMLSFPSQFSADSGKGATQHFCRSHIGIKLACPITKAIQCVRSSNNKTVGQTDEEGVDGSFDSCRRSECAMGRLVSDAFKNVALQALRWTVVQPQAVKRVNEKSSRAGHGKSQRESPFEIASCSTGRKTEKNHRKNDLVAAGEVIIPASGQHSRSEAATVENLSLRGSTNLDEQSSSFEHATTGKILHGGLRETQRRTPEKDTMLYEFSATFSEDGGKESPSVRSTIERAPCSCVESPEDKLLALVSIESAGDIRASFCSNCGVTKTAVDVVLPWNVDIRLFQFTLEDLFELGRRSVNKLLDSGTCIMKTVEALRMFPHLKGDFDSAQETRKVYKLHSPAGSTEETMTKRQMPFPFCKEDQETAALQSASILQVSGARFVFSVLSVSDLKEVGDSTRAILSPSNEQGTRGPLKQPQIYMTLFVAVRISFFSKNKASFSSRVAVEAADIDIDESEDGEIFWVRADSAVFTKVDNNNDGRKREYRKLLVYVQKEALERRGELLTLFTNSLLSRKTSNKESAPLNLRFGTTVEEVVASPWNILVTGQQGKIESYRSDYRVVPEDLLPLFWVKQLNRRTETETWKLRAGNELDDGEEKAGALALHETDVMLLGATNTFLLRGGDGLFEDNKNHVFNLNILPSANTRSTDNMGEYKFQLDTLTKQQEENTNPPYKLFSKKEKPIIESAFRGTSHCLAVDPAFVNIKPKQALLSYVQNLTVTGRKISTSKMQRLAIHINMKR